MRKLLLGALFVALAASPAFAQRNPGGAPLTSTNLSSTIASTGVFQSIQIYTPTRSGCTIQNNGTHNMDVFFGPIAGATVGGSVVLLPGQAVGCLAGSSAVLIDQVSITGTATEPFFAGFQ